MPPRGVQEAPKNFSWLIVNEIAGCGMINSEFELLWLKDIGIKHILCLNKDHKDHYPNGAKAEIHGLKVKVIYIKEFEAPEDSTRAEILHFLREIKPKNEAMVVHCLSGNGRTGVVLAMYLMLFHNKPAMGAIGNVRSLRPRSIETAVQEKFIYEVENEIKAQITIES